MSEQIDSLRKAFAQNAATRSNIRRMYPYDATIGPQITVGEQKASPGAVDVRGPVEATLWAPLQVTDTTSANLGLFYFVPDMDYPGDATKVIR